MRKILLSFFVVLGCSFAYGQSSGFGLKTGLNFANLSGSEVESSSRTGFHLGGYYNVMLTDRVSIQPELQYSTQGATSEDATLRLDYINIPLSLKYYLNKGLYASGGIEIGLNVNSELEFLEEFYEVEANSMVLGLGLGLGYETEKGFIFSFRYNRGLSNVFPSETTLESGGNIVPAEAPEARNSVIQLSIGYQFTTRETIR